MIDQGEISATLEPATTSSTFNGVRLSSRIMPAVRSTRGGDWCEAFALSEDVVALSIGDMCGHGSEKFEAMVATRQAIRDAAHRGCNPAQALAEANRLLYRCEPAEYATAIFALLNTNKRSLVFANAGHPPPLMSGANGTLFLEFAQTDLSLGVEADFMPAVHEVAVQPATLLVFYTDGVSERKREPLQGAAQLRAAALFAYQFSSLLTASVIEEQMSLTGPNPDDAAILTAWTPAERTAESSIRIVGRSSDHVACDQLGTSYGLD